jgi:hypothetical protein
MVIVEGEEGFADNRRTLITIQPLGFSLVENGLVTDPDLLTCKNLRVFLKP